MTKCGVTSTVASSIPEQRALDYYRLAVEHEQNSLLDDALCLYQKSFRLDPNADRAYYREQQKSTNLTTPSGQQQQQHGSSSRALIVAAQPKPLSIEKPGRSPISNVIEQFPREAIAFTALDIDAPIPLAALADEVLIQALRELAAEGDYTALERFALACRKARLLALDATLWKYAQLPKSCSLCISPVQRTLVMSTYIYPQQHGRELIQRYRCDYRRLFIECARVRYDGAYISVCHYVCVAATI